MSGKSRLKQAAVAYAMALSSILPSFNSIAGRTEGAESPTPLRLPPSALSFKTAISDQATAKMGDIFGQIDAQLKKESKNKTYKPENDPALAAQIESLKSLLRQGADANHYPAKGYTIKNASGLSALQAALEVAFNSRRPDLVQAFVDQGADIGRPSPDGWHAMDYAVIEFMSAQDKSALRTDNATRIMAILAKAGGTLAQAKEAADMMGTAQITAYANMTKNVAALESLRKAGLIDTDEFNNRLLGKIDFRQVMQDNVAITDQLLEQYGAKFSSYPDAVPGGPEPYQFKPDDTLESVAARFYAATGQPDAATGLAALLNLNKIAVDSGGRPVRQPAAGETILIPVPMDRQIGITKPRSAIETLVDIVTNLRPILFNGTRPLTELAQEVAAMNGIAPDQITVPGAVEEGRPILILFTNDSHNQVPPLKAPAHFNGNREVDLFVIESKDDHAKDTYRVSSGTGYSINPNIKLEDVHQWDEVMLRFPNITQSDALVSIISNMSGPVQDRILFSQSMAMKRDERTADLARQSRDADDPGYESVRVMLDFMNAAKPILFTAAGNFMEDEGRYIQSFTTLHSPRAVLMGAVGAYPSTKPDQKYQAIAPYSSFGADICAPLPNHLGRQMEGTSFSTPYMAALYRQMSEWYGDRLSFEEIMAGAMMTASQDIMDYTDPAAVAGGKKPDVDMSMKPAAFTSNGGGVPQNGRCGAGIVDLVKWQAALDKMVDLKTKFNRVAKDEGITQTLTIGTPSIIQHGGGKSEYVYRMKIGENMTLGRLTFRLPQYIDKHSEIVVRTPAGYESHLGKALTDIISTFNFAYEDVRAGDYIELRSNQPLGPTAGVILRGHTPGNVIAMLRNSLRAQNLLPPALYRMAGEQVLGPAPGLRILRDAATPATVNKQTTPPPANAEPPAPDRRWPIPMPIVPGLQPPPSAKP